MDVFVSLNKTPDIFASVLWDTLKVYIRGETISYTGYEKKLREQKLFNLTQLISQLDNLYASFQSPDIFKERLSLQAELNVLMSHRTTELMLQSQSTFFEHSDKASKILAHQIRQPSSHTIFEIQTNSGTTSDPLEINKTFGEFYCSLYSSD